MITYSWNCEHSSWERLLSVCGNAESPWESE